VKEATHKHQITLFFEQHLSYAPLYSTQGHHKIYVTLRTTFIWRLTLSRI